MTVTNEFIESLEWGKWEVHCPPDLKSSPLLRFSLEKHPVWVLVDDVPTQTMARLVNDRNGVVYLGLTDLPTLTSYRISALDKDTLIELALADMDEKIWAHQRKILDLEQAKLNLEGKL